MTFNNHIFTLCKKASNQLNTISWLQRYIDFKGKEILISRFMESNFNYFSFLWYFCSSKSQRKKGKLLEHAPKVPQNDYNSVYSALQHKPKTVRIDFRWLSLLAMEVFKTLSSLNTINRNKLFQKTKFLTHRSSNIEANIAALKDK